MTNNKLRPLKVFLCHASDDKPAVYEIYLSLVKNGVDAWLDKEKLIPGQNWEIEIQKAVRNSDIVIVFLSSHSINKDGFIQKEIRIALDAADEKPEGTIFIIPARLENCNVPRRISHLHWVDLFSDNGYEWLLRALQLRASAVGANFDPNNISDNFVNTDVDANFEKIWVDFDEYEGDEKGMRMHFKFNIEHHKDKQCRLIVYFEFEDGTELKDYNNSYGTINGNVSVGQDFEPGFDDAVYDDLEVFMPYDELHLSEGNSDLRFCASLYDMTTITEITQSDYYLFYIKK